MTQNPNPIILLRQQNPGLNRLGLAKAAGVAYITLSYIENGLNQAISERVASKLANALNTTPKQLQADYANWRQSLQQSQGGQQQ